MNPTFSESHELAPKPKTGLAVVGLLCGLFAFMVPIPVADVIAGLAGYLFAVIALFSGVRALAVVALVFSSLGIHAAIDYTLQYFGVLPYFDWFDFWHYW